MDPDIEVKFTWSENQCKVLVSMLEAELCLWDRTNPSYKNKSARFDSLSRIAGTLGIPVTFVENKIKCITSQFQRELKKEATRSGGDERYISKWYLFPHLQFLCRTASTGLASYTGSQEEMLQSSEIYEEELVDELSDNPCQLDEEQESAINSSSAQLYKVYKRKKIEDINMSKAVPAVSKSPSNVPPEKEKDEWELFGALIAKKIRNLKSPLLRLQAENEINAILLKKVAEDAGYTILTSEFLEHFRREKLYSSDE